MQFPLRIRYKDLKRPGQTIDIKVDDPNSMTNPFEYLGLRKPKIPEEVRVKATLKMHIKQMEGLGNYQFERVLDDEGINQQ